MDLIRQQWISKCSFPRWRLFLETHFLSSNGKGEKNSEKNDKIHGVLATIRLIEELENKIFQQTDAHFTRKFFISLRSRNEEKLVALLV